MTGKSDRVICEECDVEMIHHADKVVLASGGEEEAMIDPDLGGIVESAHCCPGCGSGHTVRREAPGRS